jgi:hypothetical protein
VLFQQVKSVPIISPGATSVEYTDKTPFPFLLRTVGSDKLQRAFGTSRADAGLSAVPGQDLAFQRDQGVSRLVASGHDTVRPLGVKPNATER